MSLEPLVIEFELNVPPAAAFAVWTERCATWWPRAHTISGDPSAITFEPRPGGQIVEQCRWPTASVGDGARLGAAATAALPLASVLHAE